MAILRRPTGLRVREEAFIFRLHFIVQESYRDRDTTKGLLHSGEIMLDYGTSCILRGSIGLLFGFQSLFFPGYMKPGLNGLLRQLIGFHGADNVCYDNMPDTGSYRFPPVPLQEPARTVS